MGRNSLSVTVLAILGLCATAYGLCEIKFPLSKVWKISSVTVGTIESARDGNHILTVRLTAVLKESAAKGVIKGDAAISPATEPVAVKTAQGEAKGEILTLQIVKPEDLCARAAINQPLVIVRSSMKDILIHVADNWYQAQPGNTPGSLRIIALREDFRGTFTGHTSDLIGALEELKAGKSTLIDERPPRFLSTQVKLGTVSGVKDVAAIAAGTDDKGQALVYIRTSAGPQVFSLKEGVLDKGVDEAAQKDFIGKHVVPAAEIEKSPLLKKSISMTRGGFGADGSAAVLAVRENGLVRIMDSEKAAGETDDDLCLIGSRLNEYITEWKDGITDAIISTCDVNGDGRDDAVIVSSKGTLVLLNRGFGIFLVVKADGEAFKGAVAATADPVSGGLLVLRRAEDGSLELWRSSTPNP